MESESSQQFCLRWHNHQSSVLGGLPALLDSGRLTDVTLCAGGRSLRAHRIVLSTCSPYFMDIFKDLPATQQPVVVILGGGWAELCCLVAFMYAGEVTLPRTLLPSLLRLARALHITGLTDLNGNVPDVPLVPEYDESTTDNRQTDSVHDMKLSRQNSDSTNSVDNTVFHRSLESHSSHEPTPSDSTPESICQELELLKQLSRQYIDTDRVPPAKDEAYNEKIIAAKTQGKRTSKSNRPKYLTPALNELESKNRNIDKIVESLKCNQLKCQEMGRSQSPRAFDGQSVVANLISKDKVTTVTTASPDLGLLNISKATDGGMETDAGDASSEGAVSNIPHPSSSAGQKLYATCYVCHKRLSNQYNLRVHLETHQNARHACIACNHVSRSRDALRKHVSYRHPQLNVSHSVGRPCKVTQNAPGLPGCAFQRGNASANPQPSPTDPTSPESNVDNNVESKFQP